jgi:hypothetical protein
MAKNIVKVLVAVEVEEPDNNIVEGKLKGADRAEWIRNRAESDVADALIHYELNPKVLRVRLAREKA